MKKVFLSILLTLLPFLANAETVEIDGIWYTLIPKGNVAEVTKNPSDDFYTGSYSGEIIIPEKITYEGKEYPVKKIGDYAFHPCHDLNMITIPNSVTSIGNCAFASCHNLTSITIPNSVTTIGYTAFSDCISLSSINIPYGVEIIDDWTFSSCSALTSVTIPNSVKIIERSAFKDCTNLISVIIPNSVTTFGSEVFSGCSSLSSVIIGNSMTSIGDYAFTGCSSLTTIIIPDNVKSIFRYAFSGCSKLEFLTIGAGVNYISSSVFSDCPKLKDVYCLAEEIPNTNLDVFTGSYIEYATLHVPAASFYGYSNTQPWKNFGAIVMIEDGDNPEIKKCATPEISYANGKVSLSCETEGVEFVSEVAVDDAKKYYDSEFNLSQTYKISVYATKAGYENSDVATREIVIENGQSSLFGDLNKDGKVNVADHVKLSDIIMNK